MILRSDGPVGWLLNASQLQPFAIQTSVRPFVTLDLFLSVSFSYQYRRPGTRAKMGCKLGTTACKLDHIQHQNLRSRVPTFRARQVEHAD